MTNQDYLNELIKTIPIAEREISMLGEIFDRKEKERDSEFLNCIRKVSREASERLNGDRSADSMEEIVSDMLLLFGTNHLRVRLTNNTIQSLREDIANGKP